MTREGIRIEISYYTRGGRCAESRVSLRDHTNFTQTEQTLKQGLFSQKSPGSPTNCHPHAPVLGGPGRFWELLERWEAGYGAVGMDSESASAPLLMGDAPELNASPVRSAQLRSHAQHPGTPPRVAPPSQVARSPGGTPMAVISPKQRSPVGRLGSLDAVRGMTVCLMIFVDNVGDWLPHVNHSPWDDVTLADFVMPFFLFMVGCSMALSFSKYNGSIARTFAFWQFKSLAPAAHPPRLTDFVRHCSVVLFGNSVTYKIIWRTVKLFIIGVATQGADLWGGGGFDMSNIRIPGILQRIAWVRPCFETQRYKSFAYPPYRTPTSSALLALTGGLGCRPTLSSLS